MTRPRVLIVDDEENLDELVQGYLEREGYAVVSALDGPSAVALARDGVIPPQEAVMRVEPRALSDLLHHQVDPRAPRDLVARGINASPGAATGKIVFTAAAAQASAARGEACILVRRETAPEDIRGMHSAVAVLTERGGMTSHAAVIARGLGLPCVVGASELRLDTRDKKLTATDGRLFREGDLVTLDGSKGEALAGAAEMLPPALDDSFRRLLAWADEVRDIGIRANIPSGMGTNWCSVDYAAGSERTTLYVTYSVP